MFNFQNQKITYKLSNTLEIVQGHKVTRFSRVKFDNQKHHL